MRGVWLSLGGGNTPPERNTAWNKGRKCFHCLGTPNNLIRPRYCCHRVTTQLQLTDISYHKTPISFSAVHRLPVFNRHRCRFIGKSDVKFLCFVTLRISLAHFTLGCPHQRISATDQAILHSGHLLPSMLTMCPHHSSVLFSILSKTVYVTPVFFSLITSFPLLAVRMSCRLFHKNQCLYLTFF